MEPRYRARQNQSEVQMILEFLGFKTIATMGIIGSLYLYSGYRNFSGGGDMTLMTAFSPYYALHFHDGGDILSGILSAIGNWMTAQMNAGWQLLIAFKDRMAANYKAKVDPFFREHPIFAFVVIGGLGAMLSVGTVVAVSLAVKKILALLPTAYTQGFTSAKRTETEEVIWLFDPRKRPTDEQMKKMYKSLERLVQRAPAMGGSAPQNADISIRELAKRNNESEYIYRCAIYVMGPIKGTNYDESYEIPISFEQIKMITSTMGPAATYENLPLDLVLLRSKKKDTKSWELDPTTLPVKLGKNAPLKTIEQVMVQYRNHFIWDGRAKKSITRYGKPRLEAPVEEAPQEK